MESRVDPVEQRNDERHRRIAAMIRRDPSLVQQASLTLQRWLADMGDPPLPALVEWQVALAMLSPEELADFLESTTPRARRMRISSPFVGLVPR